MTAPQSNTSPMRLLVSVRSVAEARLVAQSGAADFIDLKEPGQGALGGLPIAAIRAIVESLRALGCTLPVSATIGDWPAHRLAEILAAVDAVGACGVDYVKVGIEHRMVAETATAAPDRRVADVVARPSAGQAAGGALDSPSAVQGATARLLDALAASRWSVVPVFIGDDGIDAAAVASACRLRAERGPACFPALMVDTEAKHGGSLFARVSIDALRRFLADVRQTGALAGLAGALRLPDLPALAALSPDFAGFRSAVCAGDRAGTLDPTLLASLAERLHGQQPAA